MPVVFPSLAFFAALQREMRAERERFSRLGFFDTTFGIRVLPEGGGRRRSSRARVRGLRLRARRATASRPSVDFVIEGPLAAWREMLDNIHALGAADAAHSLNTLTHFGEQLCCATTIPTATTSSTASPRASRSSSTSRRASTSRYPDGSTPAAAAASVARRVAT